MKRYDVFISYRNAQEGFSVACMLHQILERQGYRVYVDHRELHASPDKGWSDQIRDAMRSSRTVLFVLSKGCFDGYREMTYIEEDRRMDFLGEIHFAVKNRCNIVGVRTPDWQSIHENDRALYHESIGALLDKQLIKYQIGDTAQDKPVKELMEALGTSYRIRTRRRSVLLGLAAAVGCMTIALLSSFLTKLLVPPKQDFQGPDASIGASVKSGQPLKAGSTLSIELLFLDESGVQAAENLVEKIELVNFNAAISVAVVDKGDKFYTGRYLYKIYLNNIQGETGNNKVVRLLPGAVLDGAGNPSYTLTLREFGLYNADEELDRTKPVITIDGLKESYKVTETVQFRVIATDDKGCITRGWLKDQIMLRNFTGEISVKAVDFGNGYQERKSYEVTIAQLTPGENCCIALPGGVAADEWDNESDCVFSMDFDIGE